MAFFDSPGLPAHGFCKVTVFGICSRQGVKAAWVFPTRQAARPRGLFEGQFSISKRFHGTSCMLPRRLLPNLVKLRVNCQYCSARGVPVLVRGGFEEEEFRAMYVGRAM